MRQPFLYQALAADAADMPRRCNLAASAAIARAVGATDKTIAKENSVAADLLLADGCIG